MRTRLDHPPFDYQSAPARSNFLWRDHTVRTFVTGGIIASLAPDTIMDPACGDGSILAAAYDLRPFKMAYLGDITDKNGKICGMFPASGLRWQRGTIERSLDAFPKVDVVVLTEILEHLDDPDKVLKLARAKGSQLVASSPEMRPGQIDDNPEHLWMFDRAGYRDMLVGAGWQPYEYTKLEFETQYDYGIWVCR